MLYRVREPFADAPRCAIWDCAWRGLPEPKDCAVLLCRNGAWESRHGEPSQGEFGVWISLGPRAAWTPAGQTWVRDAGSMVPGS